MAQEITAVKTPSTDIEIENGDTFFYSKEGSMSAELPRLPLRKRLQHTFMTRDGWFGNFDYVSFCMPRIPFYKRKVGNPIFYGPFDDIPVLVALLMGVQRK